MKKALAMALALGVGFSGLLSLNAEARGCRGKCGRTHHVASHSRRITTIKNGITRTRTVHVNGHVSH